MKTLICCCLCLLTGLFSAHACSILYYIDAKTGKIYAVNNEDYWFDVSPYILIQPHTDGKLARLWYGWGKNAQGGINEAGLFFDGAVTPQVARVKGYHNPVGNLGDDILAQCHTVEEALALLEEKKVALTDGHLLFGDRQGHATVVEWVNGKRNLVNIQNNVLMATNFLLTDKEKGNYPCPRYAAMEAAVQQLQASSSPVGLKEVGNIAARAVQPMATGGPYRKAYGTLYTSFINITDMEFVLVYKLDNAKQTKLDLKAEFAKPTARTISLQ
ncbi:carcinine hydrolase/isopenicillin-N N-acyltransferase family protein [Chitinophaga qingshengii]|uniref:Penicillin acylase n=1 Tax=Chitinophaga qingshengii TaxID=1569794 RepID=A0ABR7TLM1_9BACT|nr:carcinine hydrolase/isopenicillin-N N-acyltransferase family protein [Chitinophaga qingshengii]MBC9930535.1 penicillin acylase [Chitinophaga qingshengii]